MANQGYPYEGNDKRVLGGVFGKIFTALSWNSKKQPLSLIFTGIGFKLYVPLWMFGREDLFMLRAGWHYDINAKAYILGFAAKVVKDAGLY